MTYVPVGPGSFEQHPVKYEAESIPLRIRNTIQNLKCERNVSEEYLVTVLMTPP